MLPRVSKSIFKPYSNPVERLITTNIAFRGEARRDNSSAIFVPPRESGQTEPCAASRAPHQHLRLSHLLSFGDSPSRHHLTPPFLMRHEAAVLPNMGLRNGESNLR